MFLEHYNGAYNPEVNFFDHPDRVLGEFGNERITLIPDWFDDEADWRARGEPDIEALRSKVRPPPPRGEITIKELLEYAPAFVLALMKEPRLRPLGADITARASGANTVLTVFDKIGGPLTKQISLTKDGSILSDGSACKMSEGKARRVTVRNVGEQAALIGGLQSHQAIALGTLRDDLPDQVEVVVKGKLNGAPNVARSQEYIVYRPGQPAWALIDFDSKGMPAEVATKIKECGGNWSALLTVLPALREVARVTRRSTSAGLFRSDIKKQLPGSENMHIYVTVQDGADIERFLGVLHDRCWLAGLGWMMVGAGGQLLVRSLVDRMVGGAERLVFEADPIVKPPLKQDQKSRRPVAVPGDVLDTVTTCPPLSIVENAKLAELKAKEAHRLAGEVAKVRKAFIEQQAKRLVERTGMSEAKARIVAERQTTGVLLPDVVLPFDDDEFNGCTVGDVLADSNRFDGITLADPLEGVGYGRCKAMIMLRADGTPWIHSWAHGRTFYELKYDVSAVRNAMQAVDKEDVVKTFVRLATIADLDAEEQETLRQLAKQLSGVGLRQIDSMLKAAQQKQAAQHAREEYKRHVAERRDPRPMINAPFPDEPWLPVMDVVNEIVGGVVAAVPPLRNIDNTTTQARKMPVPNMHAFTESEVNIDEDIEGETK